MQFPSAFLTPVQLELIHIHTDAHKYVHTHTHTVFLSHSLTHTESLFWQSAAGEAGFWFHSGFRQLLESCVCVQWLLGAWQQRYHLGWVASITVKIKQSFCVWNVGWAHKDREAEHGDIIVVARFVLFMCASFSIRSGQSRESYSSIWLYLWCS